MRNEFGTGFISCYRIGNKKTEKAKQNDDVLYDQQVLYAVFTFKFHNFF